MTAVFCDWHSAVIQAYSEFSSKVKDIQRLDDSYVSFLSCLFRVSTSSNVKKWILL